MQFVFAITIVLAAQIPAASTGPPAGQCVAEPAIDAAVSAVIAAVDAGTPADIAALITARFDTARLGNRRDALHGQLGLWHWRSHDLELVSVCARDGARGSARLRNHATGEIESVGMVMDPMTGRIQQLQIPLGGTPYVAAEDTASDAARAAALQRLVRRMADLGAFSGEVLLARDGVVLLHEAAGVVDREAGRPARIGEQYNTASVGKLFTGTAIMRLAEAGRLSIDDTLGLFLAAGTRPAAAGRVALKYVLSHTSGIQRGVDTLVAQPGTRFTYENYGYHLLANVVEAVAGVPFDEHYRVSMFTPLGMTRTLRLVRSEPDPALPPAYAVTFDSAGLHFTRNPLAQTMAATGAGGMFSTVEDLFRFAEALRTDRLVARETLVMMRTPRSEFGAADYGYGIDRYRGKNIWGHTGYIPGANADVELYGDSGYVLVVLGNMPANEPIRRLAEALIGERALR